ncbi:hypothetical protein SERLA73DRAFT_184027 [Serpula lacrymans var. lacrymans S7.3]|uniref:Uncharacterized protein n=2 Tax=Serpula lacrymans var. lacrymans TaxID=341189 RepID=F8Q2E1_SERL3|nr:uncharacterized protein SERLADRAFT_471484 [Serpula lacrymans var. lacrymans S7.9]EGN97352.1 hypothetical protein SERLA73DRAFT_184027 [Serpula lacrymans var. lacrymans S7.3]EGO22944.1 hypothetical protein SERLADRAFT_471484 [Serpula lacrymans var. lacrymans S7.9]
MSTRKRTKRNASTASNASAAQVANASSSNIDKSTSTNGRAPGEDGKKIDTSNLPPPRPKEKFLKTVPPPLSTTSTSRFFYTLALLAALTGAFYAWRVMQWKGEVGGWWNLAMGKRPPQLRTQEENHNQYDGLSGWFASRTGWTSPKAGKSGEEGSHKVEDRLNALAEALGMPSHDVASAIAGAVRDHVPPASLSSIAAQETGSAVKILVGVPQGRPAEGGSTGGLYEGIERIVGMDEPPEEAM